MPTATRQRTRTSTAAIYTRLSVDKPDQTSTERQETDARAKAEALDLSVIEVFSDVGISGYKNVARPGFKAALDALAAGKFDTLIVWKLDRLSRRGIGQVGAILDRLEDTGGRIVSVMDGVDTSQASGRMVLALLSEQARAESENTATRVRSARSHARRIGLWSGRAPYGFIAGDDRKLRLDPTRAPILRRIVDEVLAGKSLRAIARDLNESAVPGPSGGIWRAPTLAQLVRTPTLAGLMPHNDDVYRDGHGQPVSVGEALITPAERRRLLAALSSRVLVNTEGRRQGAGRPPSCLLTGLLRCGECGHPFHGDATRNAYRCIGRTHGAVCPGVSVRMRSIDDHVTEAVFSRLSTLEPGDDLLDTIAARWVARTLPETEGERAALLTTAEAERTALADLEEARYVRGEFGDADGPSRYERLRGLIEERLTMAEKELAALPPVTPDVGAILDTVVAREAWAEASVSDRRDVLALAIDRVVVTKAKQERGRYDPSRVVFVWAGEAESVAPTPAAE